MQWIHRFICTAALAGAVAAGAQQKPASSPSTQNAVTISVPRPLLPDSFAGWVSADPPKLVTDPAQADSANTAALKEYGFQNGALATYKRDNDTLTVRALRFNDLSGAYGAYTYYRGSGWPKEDIGTGAASNHNRVLFWRGATVVDATYSQISPMSGSELRELARQLPAAQGNKSVAPPILANLPQHSIDGQTTHYALGPAGYAGAGGVLPADLVGFDHGAEAVTADYSLTSGPATLTLIDYPTPQMAAAQENRIRAYIQAGSKAQPAFPKPLADSDQASLEVRRSGPVVALVSGDAVPDESHRLIGSVHYESDFVSIPQPTESEVNKTGRLLMGIAALVIIGASSAILLGFFLGGGRALYRIARGRPASSVYETEFIRLDLRE
ncbi:MAG TPA: DUF6599 family protein [Terracidiphilus sp.]|jgi:hypothetical protein|nr:DUF6599 family protein [Terracidiphilus sp.]